MSALELKGVCVSRGDVEVLRDIHLQVPPGSVCTLLGANGAGKSTCLRSISGLHRPSSGEIHAFEKRIDGSAVDVIVGMGIAHVPEGRQVFPSMTVHENLLLGAYVSGMDEGHLDRVFAAFPVLKDRIQQKAGTLSGGQQQMLAIGRALMSRPRLLLMDEPSLGLAPNLVQGVGRMIARLRSDGLAILLVEQNAALALEVADYGWVLERGRIVLQGTAEDLAANPEVRRAYLGV